MPPNQAVLCCGRPQRPDPGGLSTPRRRPTSREATGEGILSVLDMASVAIQRRIASTSEVSRCYRSVGGAESFEPHPGRPSLGRQWERFLLAAVNSLGRGNSGQDGRHRIPWVGIETPLGRGLGWWAVALPAARFPVNGGQGHARARGDDTGEDCGGSLDSERSRLSTQPRFRRTAASGPAALARTSPECAPA